MQIGKVLSRWGPWFLLAAAATVILALIFATPPSSLMQLVFLGSLFLGTFAFMLLLLRAYYGRRLSAAERRIDPQRPAREALMVAGFIVFCAWLQVLRILTLTNALLLLGVLAFAEAFYISRVE